MPSPEEESGRPPSRVRMEAIATLPVFFKLAGKRAVLAGGTPPATWKAELLSAAGATVDVYAREPCAEMAALAAEPPGGPINVNPRAWTPDDLAGAAIAIGDIEEADAPAFRDAAHQHGVPVNVIDKPAYCDFQFGTVVSRSPLVIGISTDGAAPVFGQAIRTRMEALLPQSLSAWARAARDWRPALQARQPTFRMRRRFWERFSEIALRASHNEPTEADFDRCLAAISDNGQSHATLTLVGAGPGDPDAVTLLAIRALQTADVVVHQTDVSPTIVGFSRREALKIPILESADPSEAAAKLGPWLNDGRVVAWLAPGNPRTCLRWGHRRNALGETPATINVVEGLGTCATCGPDCSAFGRA